MISQQTFNSDEDAALFDVEMPPPVSLADRFIVPPFSVLNRTGSDWQDRKRRWLSMGIQSEVGRGDGLTFKNVTTKDLADQYKAIGGMTSVFDPVLCELVYRWFTRAGARVLDPFCGGSVRGVVASTLARWYYGIDVRKEQIDANLQQLNLCTDIKPTWMVGDATNLSATFNSSDEFDLIFSCPPYASLEVYSDNPHDISTWSYENFIKGHAKAILDSCNLLRNNRFAAWVIGDVRNKKSGGSYYGLHHEAVAAFKTAGLHVVNECVLADPIGTAKLRAKGPFEGSRKMPLIHQYLLIFVKGDAKEAAMWASGGTR